MSKQRADARERADIWYFANSHRRKKVKNYEEKFENEVVRNSLENIFNEVKINNFFKSF